MKTEQKNIAYRMQVFAEVVKQGSFTAAAEPLNLTKSGGSQHISQLEKELGTQLLIRTTRRLSLTHAGNVFLQRCNELDTLLGLAMDELQEAEQSPQGPLTITAPHALANAIVIPAISELASQFPGLEPRLLIDDKPRDLLQQHIDVAIRVGPLEDSSLRARALGTQREHFVASTGYLAQHCQQQPLTLDNLSQHPFIATSWQQRKKRYALMNRQQQRCEVNLPTRFRVNDCSSAAQLASLGAGIALLPNTYLAAAYPQSSLVPVLDDYYSPEDSIYAVHSYQGAPPLKITWCIRIVEKYLQRITPL